MTTPWARELRVLHVDDEPDFADLVATFLERENERFELRTASSASEGLDRLAEEDFDCIVSDYDMPGQNGIEFLETVRKEHPELPFILFTGKGSEEVASDAISAGVDDYLQKETGTDQYTILANRIENLAARHEAERLVERAYLAMDRSREGIALLDEDGDFIYVNETYCGIVGYDENELLGEFWEMVYPDEQADRIYREILDEVPEEGYWSGDTVYQRKDGSRIRVSHALVYSEEGTMICLIRDVTDLQETRRLDHERRQAFELFIDAVEDYAIFMLDPDGYVTTWNTGAERIKGYSEAAILGNHFSTFYTEEQRDRGLPEQLLQTALDAGSAHHQGPRVREDGSTFQANVVITAIYDEEGTHRGFGKVTQDMTEYALG
jgi:PAS domain S-box-containing protein